MFMRKGILKLLLIATVICSSMPSVIAEELTSLTQGPPKEKAAPPSCEPIEKDPTAWDLSVALGFNMTRGNTDTQLLNGAFDARQEKDSNVFLFNLNGADGKQSEERTQRFARGQATYQRLLTEQAYLSATASVISDDIADVDYRAVISPSGGYYLVKTEDTKISLETGPAYVFQKQGGGEDNFLAWRVANNFSWQFSQSAKLFQYAEYLLNTDDSDQSIVVAKAGIEASLTTTLALVFAVEDRFNSAPAEERKKNDVLITSALKVSF
jgi:putative salt-induced outer membrane protein YdiY